MFRFKGGGCYENRKKSKKKLKIRIPESVEELFFFTVLALVASTRYKYPTEEKTGGNSLRNHQAGSSLDSVLVAI